VGLNVSKSATLLLILAFLTASCLMVKSSFSSIDEAGDSWVSKALMPQGKSSFGLAIMDGKIYAIGGYIRNYVSSWTRGFSGTSETVNTNYEYDSALDSWTIRSPMPTPRYSFATVVYENSIYCIGGFQSFVNDPSTEVSTAAVEAFNLSTNKWETKTPMPTRRDFFATIVYADNIYCVGGGINEVYNIATDTWQTEAPMPFNGSIITANVVNGKLYLTSNSLMYIYNPATNSWAAKAPIQTENTGTVSAVIDNKIYVISANLTQIYDTETGTVSLGAPPPSNYVDGVAFATTGEMAPKRICLLNVRTTLQVAVSQADVTVQVYDPEANSWATGAKMPTNRVNVSFAVVNEKIYAIGGNTVTTSPGVYPAYPDVSFTQYATNEQYTPFGYGTPDPSYDGTAPAIAVASPENKTYYAADVALNFTVNEPASLRYTLDGDAAVEISGNTTLSGLSYGTHNLTVYATDAAGNTGASETIAFTVAEPEPFPTVLVATAFAVSAVIIAICLLVYFKKRNNH
jgi:N-acetylneuraminic acid mutarotase